MDQELKMREHLSALADGQLPTEDWHQALHYAEQESGRQAWQEYHVIGDVLRSPELAHHAHDSQAFLANLHQRLAQESVYPQHPANSGLLPSESAPGAGRAEAANQALFRWKMVAGLASLAAVSVMGWNVFEATRAGSAGAQMAAAPAAPMAAGTQVAAQQSSQEPVMLRDPRLDELVAAHRQSRGAAALQMPARFLRNANLEEPQR